MKRDMDLVRKILLDVEESDEWRHSAVAIEGLDDEMVSYHVKLLHQAGLIEAVDKTSLGTLCWHPTTLTWDGHEFLDAARDESRWGTAKNTLLSKVGVLSFDLLKETLNQLAREHGLSRTGWRFQDEPFVLFNDRRKAIDDFLLPRS